MKAHRRAAAGIVSLRLGTNVSVGPAGAALPLMSQRRSGRPSRVPGRVHSHAGTGQALAAAFLFPAYCVLSLLLLLLLHTPSLPSSPSSSPFLLLQSRGRVLCPLKDVHPHTTSPQMPAFSVSSRRRPRWALSPVRPRGSFSNFSADTATGKRTPHCHYFRGFVPSASRRLDAVLFTS